MTKDESEGMMPDTWEYPFAKADNNGEPIECTIEVSSSFADILRVAGVMGGASPDDVMAMSDTEVLAKLVGGVPDRSITTPPQLRKNTGD